MRLVLVVGLLAFFFACGDEDPCKGVTCSPGRACVAATGACEAPDAGR